MVGKDGCDAAQREARRRPAERNNMKTPIFAIVTNRGAFKAGWIVSREADAAVLYEPCHAQRPPQIRWVEELAMVGARQHLREQVSDMAGAFAATSSSGGKPAHLGSSPSETHWRIEADRRIASDLAMHINRVLEEQKPERWVLSAPADLQGELLGRLPAVCRSHLLAVIPKNLAESPIDVVVEHFLKAPA